MKTFMLIILLNYVAASFANDCSQIDFNKVDVVFAVDGSNSVGESNFQKSKSFLKDVVDQLKIGRNKTSVGVLQYPLNSRMELTKAEVVLGTTDVKQDLKNKINGMTFLQGQYTNTNQSIKDGVQMLTTKGRANVPKVLVVITDGKSSDPQKTETEAQKAHRQKIATIAVGVGDDVVRTELVTIAGDDSRVFTVDDFDVLVKFVTALTDSIRKSPNKVCYEREEGKIRVEVKKNPQTLTKLPVGKRLELECTIGPFIKDIDWAWSKDGEILPRAHADAVETKSGLRVRLALTTTASSSGKYTMRATYPNGLSKMCPAFVVSVDKTLPPVQEDQAGAIDKCRNGIFNKVFYESDVPKYCVIHEDGPNNGKCFEMSKLYNTLKPYVTRGQRKVANRDWTYEYKRYNLQVLGDVYRKPELNDDHATVHNDGFQKLFIDGLNYLQKIHPEINSYSIDGHKFGATKFCEMALTQFAMPNNILLQLISPEKCPTPRTSVCFKSPENRFPVKFPTNLNLVYYKDPSTPKSCYIPKDHVLFSTSSGPKCIFVDFGLSLLNQMEAVEHHTGTANGRNPLPGLLRIYHNPHSTTRIEPAPYRWSTFRSGNPPKKHITDILKDIDDAYGYKQDHKVNITTKSRLVNFKPKTIEMSYQAFCAAIVEMIPFKLDDLRRVVSDCNQKICPAGGC